LEPTFSLQVGIFHDKYLAVRAQKKIIAKFSLPVNISQLHEYYIVIITGFYTRNETFRYYPELAGLGYPKTLILEKAK
jgi:hypothetical protein